MNFECDNRPRLLGVDRTGLLFARSTTPQCTEKLSDIASLVVTFPMPGGSHVPMPRGSHIPVPAGGSHIPVPAVVVVTFPCLVVVKFPYLVVVTFKCLVFL